MVLGLQVNTFFTRGHVYQRHRILTMYIVVFMGIRTLVSKYRQPEDFVKSTLYSIKDESDFEFREHYNLSDKAVMREKTFKFIDKIKVFGFDFLISMQKFTYRKKELDVREKCNLTLSITCIKKKSKMRFYKFIKFQFKRK